jgi:hypothetical protein
VLAANVAGITFNTPFLPDYSVISIYHFTLVAPLDSAGVTKTLVFPDQSVRMITNQ